MGFRSVVVDSGSKYRNNRKEVRIERTEHPTEEADLAASFIEKFGAVAAVPDGYDDAGRQKMRLMTPKELVERATETAALAFAEFRARGWMVPIPSEHDLNATPETEE